MTFSTTMQQPTFYKVLFFNGLGRDVKIAQIFLKLSNSKKRKIICSRNDYVI
jgi:hypothetical protein